jgi:hypothetical protein
MALALCASMVGGGLAASPAAKAASACVTFDPPLAAGTVYGAPVGQTPGTVVLFSNNIIASVDHFTTGGPPFFNLARIESAPVAFSPGNSLRLNNLSMRFHFFALPFVPNQVTFSYLDLGGTENLAVNGSAPFMGNISAPPAMIAGASVTATSTAVAGGRRGMVRIRANRLRDFRVGGQELWIDQVCASN